MNKSILFKILSVVLILCTLITVIVVPASALNASGGFSKYFDFQTITLFDNMTGDDGFPIIDETSIYNAQYYINDTDNLFFRYYNLLSAKGYRSIQLTSYKNNISLQSGDTVSFSLSILAPWVEGITLSVYVNDEFLNQPKLLQTYNFERSQEKVFSREPNIVKFSGESTSYGDRVFCHRYVLNEVFTSDGQDISYIKLSFFESPANQMRDLWFYYEDCSVVFTEGKDEGGNSIFSVLGKIWKSIKEFFSSMVNFILDFGSKIKNALTPLFNNVAKWISDAASSTWGFFKDGINAIGDGIVNLPKNIGGFFTNLGDRIGGFFGGIGKSISDWFSETYLGKVLTITSKAKEVIAQSGTDVEYVSLDDDLETTLDDEDNSQDWDMLHRPSFEIPIEYYANLYPSVFD